MAKQSQSAQLDQAVQHILADSSASAPPTPRTLSPLLRLAADLRDLPRANFKSRLKADLQRRTSVATPTVPTVNPIRPGFLTITPYLIVNEAVQLIDFVKNVFGAEEQFRSIGSAGGLHCELKLGDAMLMIGGGAWRGTPAPSALHIYVLDVDPVYERALAAGATSLRPPADQEYGDRDASVRDPYGNNWYIATHQQAGRGHFIPEGLHSVNVYLHPKGAPQAIDFFVRALGARELERAQDDAGTIHHAKLQLGDSVLELSEARAEFPPLPTTFYLYVQDCDALYHQAIAAGATSLNPPADQPYGDRNAGVQDPYGNTWYFSTHIKDVAP